MLDGQLSFLIGSRRLAALHHEIDAADDDADFLIFVAIDSDTDALPLGAVREHWIKMLWPGLSRRLKRLNCGPPTLGLMRAGR
jgi:hypothetical protein